MSDVKSDAQGLAGTLVPPWPKARRYPGTRSGWQDRRTRGAQASAVSVGDHVSLAAADGAQASGTVVSVHSDGLRVTVRLDSNTHVRYDVGVSAVKRVATAA